MVELRINIQFPSPDAPSQVGLLHEEIVGKVMIYELYKAVAEGDADKFVEVLKQQCVENKLNSSDAFDKVTLAGDSLLHVAADLGKEKIVERICDLFHMLLIRRNVRGDTPLHVAARSKKSNSTVVKLILSQYATKKSKHDEMKDKEITRETNECGDTPLHEAVYSGHFDVVKEILDQDKAVAHCLNKSKQSPLCLAVLNDNVEILNLLLQIPLPADQPLSRSRASSPLHTALQQENKDMIQKIIAKRPKLVYLRDEDGDTPLYYAVDIDYLDGFRILLNNSLLKLDQSALERNKKGHLPLHLACKTGNLEMVKEFFEHEWPINPYVLLNQKGQNILHIAAKNGRSNVVEYLLKNCKTDHISVNQKDNDGNTPLHLASKNLFPKVIYFITQDNRTDVKLTNKDGLTAREIIDSFELPGLLQRMLLSNMVLKEAGVPVRVNCIRMLHSQRQPQPKKADISEVFLIVAALMVTVSFSAAFTVPGGVYSSDDPNPKIRGTAVFADKSLFWIFTIFNIITMFCSAIACGFLSLTRTLLPDHLKESIALEALVYAFFAAPVAFVAAILLVVANNLSLTVLTCLIGGVLTLCIIVHILLPTLSVRIVSPYRLLLLIFIGINPLIGDFDGHPTLWVLVFHPLTKIDGNKPKSLLRSQKANKNKDNGLEEHVQQGK